MPKIPIKPHVRKVTGAAYVIYVSTPYIEHVGFVMLAVCEVFSLHFIVLYVNVILMSAGAMACHYEHRERLRERSEGKHETVHIIDGTEF